MTVAVSRAVATWSISRLAQALKGSGRGNAETGFIRSVDNAVHRFYTTVVVHLDTPTTRRTPSKERTAAE
ncbi:hypothetical protein [Streptomyces albogriseolus]|uniref:hypothetical protein n=1 Tax=Streptomyces albogriseolus TaxID=1887 RepID=UPI002252CEC9|nr:hypothetical protein [Streptomyces viridodiastaticus]MCX4624712.1 hypothetical protein [Streptomyces viridodiastaticus]